MNSKMFIIIPLLILVLLTTFYTLYQIQPISIPSSTIHNQTDITGNPIVNGTSTTYEQAGNQYNITLTDTLGIMAIIAVIEIIATIAGINVLGSGLSDTSVMIIYKSAGLTIIWSVFSVTGIQVLNLIPYSFGLLLYFVFTLVYAYGVITEV
jgi:hypothetical protein